MLKRRFGSRAHLERQDRSRWLATDGVALVIPDRWKLLAVECAGLAVMIAGSAVYWRTGQLHQLAAVPAGVKLCSTTATTRAPARTVVRPAVRVRDRADGQECNPHRREGEGPSVRADEPIGGRDLPRRHPHVRYHVVTALCSARRRQARPCCRRRPLRALRGAAARGHGTVPVGSPAPFGGKARGGDTWHRSARAGRVPGPNPEPASGVMADGPVRGASRSPAHTRVLTAGAGRSFDEGSEREGQPKRSSTACWTRTDRRRRMG
jgi:hypothetical protein